VKYCEFSFAQKSCRTTLAETCLTKFAMRNGDRVTAAASAGSRQAALHIRELLLRPGNYRRRWERYAERSHGDDVNQLAVAEVLARYLWTHPRRPGDEDMLPRQLKDTVNRVLAGKMLSRPTLSLFVQAFGFPDEEVDRLWKLYEGSAKIRVLTGPSAVPPATAAAMGTVGHRTVSLHEHHYLGEDRLPARHHTQQVIESLVDGFERYPCRFDTDAVTVEVGHGCELDGPIYQIRGELHAVDIKLPEPLPLGHTATLEYWISFQYRVPPRPEFRRAAQSRIEGVNLHVEFHPDTLPKRVWWAVWDGIEGPVVEREEVTLSSSNTVERFLTVMENTIVGFYWDWD
jgi:hypothetical protein